MAPKRLRLRLRPLLLVLAACVLLAQHCSARNPRPPPPEEGTGGGGGGDAPAPDGSKPAPRPRPPKARRYRNAPPPVGGGGGEGKLSPAFSPAPEDGGNKAPAAGDAPPAIVEAPPPAGDILPAFPEMAPPELMLPPPLDAAPPSPPFPSPPPASPPPPSPGPATSLFKLIFKVEGAPNPLDGTQVQAVIYALNNLTSPNTFTYRAQQPSAPGSLPYVEGSKTVDPAVTGGDGKDSAAPSPSPRRSKPPPPSDGSGGEESSAPATRSKPPPRPPRGDGGSGSDSGGNSPSPDAGSPDAGTPGTGTGTPGVGSSPGFSPGLSPSANLPPTGGTGVTGTTDATDAATGGGSGDTPPPSRRRMLLGLEGGDWGAEAAEAEEDWDWVAQAEADLAAAGWQGAHSRRLRADDGGNNGMCRLPSQDLVQSQSECESKCSEKLEKRDGVMAPETEPSLTGTTLCCSCHYHANAQLATSPPTDLSPTPTPSPAADGAPWYPTVNITNPTTIDGVFVFADTEVAAVQEVPLMQKLLEATSTGVLCDTIHNYGVACDSAAMMFQGKGPIVFTRQAVTGTASSGGGLSTGAIIGIACGGAAVLVIAIVVTVVLVRRRREGSSHGSYGRSKSSKTSWTTPDPDSRWRQAYSARMAESMRRAEEANARNGGPAMDNAAAYQQNQAGAYQQNQAAAYQQYQPNQTPRQLSSQRSARGTPSTPAMELSTMSHLERESVDHSLMMGSELSSPSPAAAKSKGRGIKKLFSSSGR